MTQLMPLPLTISYSSKSRLVLPFWYRLTRVVPDKGPLNRCCCCCFLHYFLFLFVSTRLGQLVNQLLHVCKITVSYRTVNVITVVFVKLCSYQKSDLTSSDLICTDLISSELSAR